MTDILEALAAIGAVVGPSVADAGEKLNGNFPAALFGALGGSLSAYWLGARNERRTKLREEIAATHNAIGMTMNIMNMMFSLKGQYIKPITEQYEQQFAKYFSIVIAPNPPPGPHNLAFQTNFQILTMPHTMIDAVERTITERVPRSPAAQMLIGSLQRSIEALARTLDQRTQLIMHMRRVPQSVQILLYFGLPDNHGNQDDTFPDTLTGMKLHVDESIYYSQLMIEILGRHGKALRKAYGRRAPKAVTPDMTDSRVAPLMPDRAQFIDFERQYRSSEKPSTRARAWIRMHDLAAEVWDRVSRPFTTAR